MARDCPCGCGRKLGFTDRGIAKKVVAFDERLDFQRWYLSKVEAPEEDKQLVQSFISVGEDIRESLIAVLHGADARIVDRAELNGWHSKALRIETEVTGELYLEHKHREV